MCSGGGEGDKQSIIENEFPPTSKSWLDNLIKTIIVLEEEAVNTSKEEEEEEGDIEDNDDQTATKSSQQQLTAAVDPEKDRPTTSKMEGLIQCKMCMKDTPKSLKNCQQCSNELGERCWRCNYLCKPNYKYCFKCNVKLNDITIPPYESIAQIPPFKGEKRAVSSSSSFKTSSSQPTYVSAVTPSRSFENSPVASSASSGVSMTSIPPIRSIIESINTRNQGSSVTTIIKIRRERDGASNAALGKGKPYATLKREKSTPTSTTTLMSPSKETSTSTPTPTTTSESLNTTPNNKDRSFELASPPSSSISSSPSSSSESIIISISPPPNHPIAIVSPNNNNNNNNNNNIAKPTTPSQSQSILTNIDNSRTTGSSVVCSPVLSFGEQESTSLQSTPRGELVADCLEDEQQRDGATPLLMPSDSLETISTPKRKSYGGEVSIESSTSLSSSHLMFDEIIDAFPTPPTACSPPSTTSTSNKHNSSGTNAHHHHHGHHHHNNNHHHHHNHHHHSGGGKGVPAATSTTTSTTTTTTTTNTTTLTTPNTAAAQQQSSSSSVSSSPLSQSNGHLPVLLTVNTAQQQAASHHHRRGSSTTSGEIILSPKSSGKTDHRTNLIKEIVSTEYDYINDLDTILQVFYKPLRDELKLISNEECASVFSNIEQIHQINKELYEKLTHNNQSSSIGEVFSLMSNSLDVYSVYCNYHQKSLESLNSLLKLPQVESFFNDIYSKPELRGMNLHSFLIKPVQRICKYPLLLRELLKATPSDHCDHSHLLSAVSQIEQIVNTINKEKMEMETWQRTMQIIQSLKGSENLQLSKRQLISEGNIQLIEGYNENISLFDTKKSTIKYKKGFYFLFDDLFLFTKQKNSTNFKLVMGIPLDTILVHSVAATADKHLISLVEIGIGGKRWTFLPPSKAICQTLLITVQKLIEKSWECRVSNPIDSSDRAARDLLSPTSSPANNSTHSPNIQKKKLTHRLVKSLVNIKI
ncbi:RhoGEF domain-containing protein [Cavenderia fasciculata]|uniref:RhoGEF domain-containing protein n=1 Tax=Cavenderia fasciculata TaxID=261658 RepID=F4Q7C3_CACFS|nr:RhoGEF domain-containing protein [Cavenderia fasciculata]EGG16305.1 RhoGEF domain-containing protein [Cavenderia fasciculata]|eukprot:XP_004354689.1 RhoGEF domain-containing protein [Cavenderia fasciculata]